jgi:hypothetical protein
MMGTPGPSRLQYLNEAAHLLHSSSPSTAAFLQSRIDELISGEMHFRETSPAKGSTEKQHAALASARTRDFNVCHACGHMANKPSQSLISGDDLSASDAYTECPVCFSKSYPSLFQESISTTPARRTSVATDPASKDTCQHKPAVSIAKAPATSIRSMKAKGRKGGSLSAMLAKSKQNATSSKPGFGLDLLDLMST